MKRNKLLRSRWFANAVYDGWQVACANKQILAMVSILAMVLAMLFSFANFLEKQTQTWLHEVEVVDMGAQADTIAHTLHMVAPAPSELNRVVRTLAQNQDFRITVMNQSGDVLADSWLTTDEIAVSQSYSDKPELVKSSLHSYGVASRYSDIANKNLIYVAKRYQSEHFSGYIRIATPAARATADLAILHRELMQVIAVGFLVFLGVALYVYHHIKQTKQLTQTQQQTLACLNKQSVDITLTQKLSQALTTCESREELVDVIAKMGSHLFGESSMGALAVSPPSLDMIEIIATWGEHWPGEERFQPKDCWGFRRGGVHLSKSNSMEIMCNHIHVEEGYAVQCVPLQSQGISLGSLHIGATEQTFSNQSFQAKISAIAEQLCLAIANLNLRRKLEQQALRDPLTGLYNRRYLDDSFSREIKRAERKKTSLAVVMVDIDHFKVFNDTYGHDAGDYVIKKFAKLLFETVRGEDISCRYGGEEFALLLNEVDANVVIQRAEALLQATRDLALQHNGRSLGDITISLGLAMFPQHGRTQQALVKAADEALYRAKNEGRNQLKIAEGRLLTKGKAA